MTLITQRARLTHHLGTANTMLILFGDDAKTVAVHRRCKELKANGAFKSHYSFFLIKDLSILTPTQTRSWSAAAARYAVSRPDSSARRQVLVSGPIDDLLRIRNRAPSNLKIQRAFRGKR